MAGDEIFPCFGIVDTGADFCAFPMSFGRALGLYPLTQTPSHTKGAGGGGTAPTFHFDVVIMIAGLGDFEVRAGFMESLNALGIGVLGHLDFLDQAKILFDAGQRVFHIEVPDPQSGPAPDP